MRSVGRGPPSGRDYLRRGASALSRWPWLLVLVACADGPIRLDGAWQLHGIEAAGDVISAEAFLRRRSPGSGWGRQLWRFGRDTLWVHEEELYPGEAGAHAGCRAVAEAPLAWLPPDAGQGGAYGRWTVAVPAEARAERSAGVPSSGGCVAWIDSGTYTVIPGRWGAGWRWEVLTPSGLALRLREPDPAEAEIGVLERVLQERSPGDAPRDPRGSGATRRSVVGERSGGAERMVSLPRPPGGIDECAAPVADGCARR